jgi:hypothetical protein
MAVEKEYIKLIFWLKLKQARTNKICRYLAWLKLQIFQNHI